jgi:hypothetical protein
MLTPVPLHCPFKKKIIKAKIKVKWPEEQSHGWATIAIDFKDDPKANKRQRKTKPNSNAHLKPAILNFV